MSALSLRQGKRGINQGGLRSPPRCV